MPNKAQQALCEANRAMHQPPFQRLHHFTVGKMLIGVARVHEDDLTPEILYHHLNKLRACTDEMEALLREKLSSTE